MWWGKERGGDRWKWQGSSHTLAHSSLNKHENWWETVKCAYRCWFDVYRFEVSSYWCFNTASFSLFLFFTLLILIFSFPPFLLISSPSHPPSLPPSHSPLPFIPLILPSYILHSLSPFPFIPPGRTGRSATRAWHGRHLVHFTCFFSPRFQIQIKGNNYISILI